MNLEAIYISLVLNMAKNALRNNYIQESLVIRWGYVPEKFMTCQYQIHYFRPILRSADSQNRGYSDHEYQGPPVFKLRQTCQTGGPR